ncbi:MAG: ABC-F family ATP-binding cassette domain-containing protein [Anaerolineaceae bacterium]|jgi:ATP-binding cassette subfamily F protein 3|nr:ABC-F family ATP-binding cassette domain-containing protein [Anaerolineaceae bacterium]
MALLTTSNLSKAYGPEDIFEGVSLSIPHRARIGLVGPNGIGKTTLLRILIGEESPSDGQVNRARNLTIGYLPQEARLHSEKTLWDECKEALSELLEMGERLEILAAEMNDANAEKAEAAIASYGSLQMEFERRGGYLIDNRIRQTLEGLGFVDKDFHRPMNKLSGGQRTRAVLARLLLSEPNLLLLDEPTNHLDIAAIEWLEAYLRDWDGAVLIVSHDRYFLNQVVNTILEMTPAIETYHGNYSAYLAQREARYERRMAEFKSQQIFIEKEEEYIRRNIAGQNTRQAQGRRKRLERLMKDNLIKPVTTSRRIHLNLQTGDRSGDLVLRTRDLHIGYHDDKKTLFALPDLTLLRGECAAIIGPNGAGKTTFLKTLLEQIPPLSGEVILGANLHIGYFAQAHEGLHPDWTLMEEIDAIAPHLLPAEVRNYLAKFMFTEDDVFKQVSVLSGGERGRLALACLALQGANLLLLDEPTNHLDLAAQEVLQSIMADFNGTILLVSHDRYLIDVLGTQIWEVQPEDKSLAVFAGTYSEYRSATQAKAQAEAAQQAEESPVETKSTRPRASGMTNRQRQRLKRLEKLEEEIARLEHELGEITRCFEDPPEDPDAIHELSRDYEAVQRKMDRKLDEWTVLSDEEE